MESGNSNLGAYCTLRSEDKKKKSNNVHFGSLRNRRNDAGHISGHTFVTVDKFTVPYNQLEESISSENFSFYNDEPITKEKINEPKINESSGQPMPDLITLEDEPAEAINISLLEKIENDLLQTDATSNHCRKPNSQNNTLNIKKEDQHHQSLSAFKRLSSYCTLRPEQKRKYLLRTISHLRSSRNASLEANRALQAFQYLDSIEQSGTATGGVDVLGKTTNDSCGVSLCSDPEKVEDCLLELDAYLEEIERNCVYHNENINIIKENEMDLMHDKASAATALDSHLVDAFVVHELTTNNLQENNCSYVSAAKEEERETSSMEISETRNSFSDCGGNDDGAIGLDRNIDQNDLMCTASSIQSVKDSLHSGGQNVVYYDDSDLNRVINAEEHLGAGMPRGHPFRNTISSVTSDRTTFPRLERGEFIVIFFLIYKSVISFYQLNYC